MVFLHHEKPVWAAQVKNCRLRSSALFLAVAIASSAAAGAQTSDQEMGQMLIGKWRVYNQQGAAVSEVAFNAGGQFSALIPTSGGTASAVGVWKISNGVLFEHFTAWNPEWIDLPVPIARNGRWITRMHIDMPDQSHSIRFLSRDKIQDADGSSAERE
jgi:hypothetical protein